MKLGCKVSLGLVSFNLTENKKIYSKNKTRGETINYHPNRLCLLLVNLPFDDDALKEPLQTYQKQSPPVKCLI